MNLRHKFPQATALVCGDGAKHAGHGERLRIILKEILNELSALGHGELWKVDFKEPRDIMIWEAADLLQHGRRAFWGDEIQYPEKNLASAADSAKVLPLDEDGRRGLVSIVHAGLHTNSESQSCKRTVRWCA